MSPVVRRRRVVVIRHHGRGCLNRSGRSRHTGSCGSGTGLVQIRWKGTGVGAIVQNDTGTRNHEGREFVTKIKFGQLIGNEINERTHCTVGQVFNFWHTRHFQIVHHDTRQCTGPRKVGRTNRRSSWWLTVTERASTWTIRPFGAAAGKWNINSVTIKSWQKGIRRTGSIACGKSFQGTWFIQSKFTLVAVIVRHGTRNVSRAREGYTRRILSRSRNAALVQRHHKQSHQSSGEQHGQVSLSFSSVDWF